MYGDISGKKKISIKSLESRANVIYLFIFQIISKTTYFSCVLVLALPKRSVDFSSVTKHGVTIIDSELLSLYLSG